MNFLQVRNWDRLQHYKHRSPPWIKLYADLLENYDFADLPDSAKGHLLAIWLLASRNNNRIPNDPRWVAGRINAREAVDLDRLIATKFLEPYDPASNALALCQQGATPEKSRVEKRRSVASQEQQDTEARIERLQEANFAKRAREAAEMAERRNGA